MNNRISYQLMPDPENSTRDDLRWKVVAIEGSIESNRETIEDNLTAEEGRTLIDELKEQQQ